MAKFKIRETQIDNFNDTHNQFLEFDEGFNVICGSNEAGKSTLMEFIKKSSSAKGYIKCELNGSDFRLEAGDTKKTKENNKYLSNITPLEFKTGFIITLDDIMFAQKTKADELIDTIKDSSGNAINEKQKDYYNYIYNSKQEFALTSTNSAGVNFKNRFKEIAKLEEEIQNLKSKEEEYASLCQTIETVENDIDILNKKLECHSLILQKNQIIKQKSEIKTNSDLMNKKPEFDSLRESLVVLNKEKSREEELKSLLKTLKADYELILNKLNKLGDLDIDTVLKMELSLDDLKVANKIIDSQKELDMKIKSLKEKLEYTVKSAEQTRFEIKSIQATLDGFGIDDIEKYKNDKLLLSNCLNRYSEISDKSLKTENTLKSESAVKSNRVIMSLIFGGIFCASAGLILINHNSNLRYALIAILLASFVGMSINMFGNSSKSNISSIYADELTKIASEIIKLLNSNGYKLDNSDNFPSKVGAFIQNMSEKSNDYKYIADNLKKETEKLERLENEKKQYQEDLNDLYSEQEKLKNSESELLKKVGIVNISDFQTAYDCIKELKLLKSKECELENGLRHIDKLVENFADSLNEFIKSAKLTEFINFSKHDYNKFNDTAERIDKILCEILSNGALIKDLDTKIITVEQKLKEFPAEFISYDITEENIAELKSLISAKVNECGMLKQQKSDLESVSNLIVLKNKKSAELNKIKDSISKLIQKEVIYNIIKYAKDRFNSTQPNLISATDYLSKITSGKYDNIDFEMKTISGNGLGEKDWDNLSRGTKEQLYLALRLGYANNYSKDIDGNPNGQPNLPVIIDDAFVNFDRERTAEIIKCLAEFCTTNQVLYFTCHSSEVKEILKQGKINHKLIEL